MQASGLATIQPTSDPSNKSRPTKPKFNVLHRYYRHDKETTKDQNDETLSQGSKNERCVVFANEASEGAEAVAICS